LLSAHIISAAPDYEDIIEFNTTTADKGDIIEVTSDVNPLMEITASKLLYKGREVIVEGNTFEMINANVAVTPIWNTFPYTKVFFTDYNDALKVANAVNDNTFNDRLQIKVDDVVYYVVYDSNHELKSDLYGGLESVSKIVFGQHPVSVEASAFANCTKLTDVILNSGIESIGDYAFYNCTSLSSSLKFPKSLKVIGMSSFENSAITGLNFNDGIDMVGDKAFYCCPNLLPKNCNDIPDGTILGSDIFSAEFYEENDTGSDPSENLPETLPAESFEDITE
jgi:hypothetical protein